MNPQTHVSPFASKLNFIAVVQAAALVDAQDEIREDFIIVGYPGLECTGCGREDAWEPATITADIDAEQRRAVIVYLCDDCLTAIMRGSETGEPVVRRSNEAVAAWFDTLDDTSKALRDTRHLLKHALEVAEANGVPVTVSMSPEAAQA